MRKLKILNTVAIGIPLFIAFLGIFDDGMLVFALISTMATGFIQVIVGIILWFKELKNSFIISYLVGVILFFVGISITNSDGFWIMPPILCIYLSLLVYTQKN
ncbi:MAG TPA: hypothetical protein PLL09_10570 [Flavobacterium sp.]|uniref:hypothetical protein n=1 Tax=unclassified Flavobacterium TaxID=196869 RepID=UPI0025C121CF|nr:MULTISPECIES: hypothetical protein [unclassified Flavobacterium]HRE78253.1 hypothetical protein [Flavobacterium sp.]